MPSASDYPLGYLAGKQVLELGRSAFFGTAEYDLPKARSRSIAWDDRIPQFGYVGTRFAERRVLILGINSGNGPNNVRNAGDQRQMQTLHRFADDPTPESFVEAQRAYRAACESWPWWRRLCNEVLCPTGLSPDQIAYSNCLPWRTASTANFNDSIAECAATRYAPPLIEELKPCIIVAFGKKAESILTQRGATPPTLITWNRSRAPTALVRRERALALAQLSRILKRCPHTD